MIPYGRQNINEEDIEAVIEVLKSDFITQGPVVPEFEKAVAKYTSANYGVAVNSATSALHIACLALGVGRGDVVWTSPISFVASSNCAIYCGAKVDFVDIDKNTYNMSIDCLEMKLKDAKRNNTLPKVVIPVHLAGQSCEMEEIKKLSDKYGFKIIEDASHAIGGKYKDQPVGSCNFSDITVFSFHPVKIITTGEGGIALTNDEKIANDMAKFRSHGIIRNKNEMTQKEKGLWHYEQVDLGFNYRMTDIYAALGLSQLKRIDEFIKRRHEIANIYDKRLKKINWLSLPFQDEHSYTSYHLYIIRIKNEISEINHRDFFEKLRNSGLLVNLHYIPIYRHPFYSNMGFNKKDFPESESYFSEAISIPIFPSLRKEEQEEIVKIIKSPLGFQSLF